MLKKISKILVRVALLGVIVILGVTAIVPGWYDDRQIIIDHVTAKFMSKDNLIIREDAQRQNIPYKEYKATVLQRKAEVKKRELLFVNLKKAIETQNDQQLTTLISNAKKKDLPHDLYAQAIKQNYVKAIEIIHQNGVKCTATPEQYRDDTSLYNFIGTIRFKTIEAVLVSTPTIFQKWVGLGCYKVHKKIEFRLIKNDRLPELLQGISADNKDNELWEKLLWQSIFANKDNITQQLLDSGIELSDEFLLAANSDRSNNRKIFDIYTLLIHQGKFALAQSILDKQPNYIDEKNLHQSIFDTLKNGSQSTAHYESIPSSLLRLEALNIDASSELEQAVTKGYFTRIVWLLELDPSLNFSILSDLDIDYSKFDRKLAYVISKYATLLLDRSLDLKVFEYKGLDQLASVIRSGDVDTVALLLEENLPLDKLYRTKSILDVKTTKNTHNKEAIQTLLINKGAHNDLGKLVRQETGVKYNPQCRIGKRNVKGFGKNNEFLKTFNQSFKKGAKDSFNADNYGICHVSLLICTKDQVNGLDNCFESVPSCSTNDKHNTLVSKDKPLASLCCPAAAKFRYNELRCSGLGVMAAAFTIADMGFPTTYSIPTFILNTQEYQENTQQEQQNDQKIKDDLLNSRKGRR